MNSSACKRIKQRNLACPSDNIDNIKTAYLVYYRPRAAYTIVIRYFQTNILTVVLYCFKVGIFVGFLRSKC